MTRNVFAGIIVGLAALSSGCASLSNNVQQPIVVATTCGDVPVQGAQCRIINARGSWNVQSTPASVLIRRAPSDLAIDCKMSQSQAMPVLTESFANRGAWGNLLGIGVFGWAYDAWSDAAWKYDSQYVVDLCKGVPADRAKAIQTSTADVPAGSSPTSNMTSVVPGQQKYAMSAEAMAKQKQCTSNPRAVLNARGPATEVYTVGCNDGNTLMLKCTWGECKTI